MPDRVAADTVRSGQAGLPGHIRAGSERPTPEGPGPRGLTPDGTGPDGPRPQEPAPEGSGPPGPGSQGPAPVGLLAVAQALAAGEMSSVEVVTSALDRIHATQPTLNAFRCVREQAVAEAAEADRRLASGERRPLLGVPVAVKDDTDVAGLPTAFGCPGAFPVATADSEVTRRLRAAGAVIVGKTNTPELGQWPFTEGPSFGVTRNPWNLDHVPGGSSGGSAAAVAAGLVPAAVGSDGAGSVRIPAAWTNLVGIKPQRGRISSAPSAEQFNGLTCYGTLGRTVADAAALLDVLTGSTAADRHRPPAPAEPFLAAARREPGRLRIGLSLGVPYSGLPARLDDGIRRAVERLAGLFAGRGHEVTVAEVPYGLLGVTFLPRSLAGVREWSCRVPDPSLLDPRTHAHARAGRWLGGPVLALARAAEPAEQARIGRVFRTVDVVLAPTTASPPPRIAALGSSLTSRQTDRAVIAACPYTWPWNVLGWPSVNVPAGFTADGLPIGAQLIGPANSEARLLSLAAELEDVERWHERSPEDSRLAPGAL